MTYPTISPELTLDFAKSEQLDPRITFSRSSSATYLDSDGLIKTAPDGVARFEYDSDGKCLGLLVEEARTNNFQYSTELDNAYWDLATGLTKTANNAVSPDGNTTALLVTEDTSTGLHVFGKSTNVSVSLNCMGIFVKPNGKTRVGFRQGNESTANVIFNLSGTGSVVSGNGFIEQYPNGWFRVTQSRQSTGNKTYFHLLNDADDALSYTGDGTSGCWIWGYQKEAGTFPSSFIPTAGATATRAADLATIKGDTWLDVFSAAGSSIFAEASFDYTVDAATFPNSFAGPNLYTLDGRNQSWNKVWYSYVENSSRGCVEGSGGAGGAIELFHNTVLEKTGTFKSFLTFDIPNDRVDSAWNGDLSSNGGGTNPSLWVNAFRYQSSSTGITIGGKNTGNRTPINGRVARISLYPSGLPDASLEALTA